MGIGMAANIAPLVVLQPTHQVTSQPTSLSTQISSYATTSSTNTQNSTTRTIGSQDPTSTSTPSTSISYSSSLTSNSNYGNTGTTETSSTSMSGASKQQWIEYAQTAWRFFSPGVGVSPTTGLICASPYWCSFTDWDLGGYILAVLSAQKLGLIGANGTWGADYRLKLVLNFLDNRPLTANGLTYQFYDSDTGTLTPDGPTNVGNIIDEGRLLIALYDTKQVDPALTPQVDQAVNHVNYTNFAQNSRFADGDIYARYAALGFNLWGFKTPSAPNESSPAPGSFLVAEPVVSSILEGVNDTYMTAASQEIYEAQYAAYNRTGSLFAMSEGQYPPYLNSSTPYVYEGIEVPSGSSYYVQTWQGQNVNSSPEAFTKIGFAFYAIYGTTYSALLVRSLGNLTTSNGYMEGILSETGQAFDAVSDNSNIMIMEACAYAVSPI